MSRQAINDCKPFVSLVIIVATLFGLVFFKMEARRAGYSILKLAREERRLRDQQREQLVQLAKILRPDRLHNVAQTRLTLRKAESGQIIQMTDQGIALKQ
ncbi:MAG: histidine kinase [Bdellovibrionaceae bacterium]|nr:histidine kinase [Pseudobdellovibrionaceae bacterium]